MHVLPAWPPKSHYCYNYYYLLLPSPPHHTHGLPPPPPPPKKRPVNKDCIGCKFWLYSLFTYLRGKCGSNLGYPCSVYRYLIFILILRNFRILNKFSVLLVTDIFKI